MRAATVHLTTVLLPAFAEKLLTVPLTLTNFVHFPRMMQSASLNMRFLSQLSIYYRTLMTNEHIGDSTSESAMPPLYLCLPLMHVFGRSGQLFVSMWSMCVLSELAARAFKRALRAQLRLCTNQSAQRQVIASFLTNVRTSAHFWRVTLPQLLLRDEWRDCPLVTVKDPNMFVSLHLGERAFVCVIVVVYRFYNRVWHSHVQFVASNGTDGAKA